MTDYKLNTGWDLWYHSIENSNWGNDSYKSLYKIRNLHDIHFLKENIQQNYLQNGMFFVMREDIFPTWEDPDNRLGGCISFKVLSNDILDSWNKLFLNLISENISLNEKDFYEINGISISPKKEFNIIKIWLRNDTNEFKNLVKEIDPYFKLENSLYKKHELEY